MSTPRLRRNLTGVVSTGNGSSRIDSTIAEEIAEEALKTAQKALEATDFIQDASNIIDTLSNKLDKEILRSTLLDEKHAKSIEDLVSKSNSFEITFVDTNSEEIWNTNNIKENTND